MSLDSITPYLSLDELHHAACEAFVTLAQRCIREQGVFRVSLSGGSTPKRLYELLSQRDEVVWQQVHWFWGDERNVPHDHPDSNYRMVRHALLDSIEAPQSNVHPVPVDVDSAADAAARYERTLREHFPTQSMPNWDLVLLGMGDDAHTASLFPATTAIKESSRWFVENWVARFDAYRYTLTAPAINSGAERWFLVAGAGKKQALEKVFAPEGSIHDVPSRLIKATRWFITADAMPD